MRSFLLFITLALSLAGTTARATTATEKCVSDQLTRQNLNNYLHSYLAGNAMFPQFGSGITLKVMSRYLSGDFTLGSTVERVSDGSAYDQVVMAMNRLHTAHGVTAHTKEAAGPGHTVITPDQVRNLINIATHLQVESALKLIEVVDPKSEAHDRLVSIGLFKSPMLGEKTLQAANYADDYLEEGPHHEDLQKLAKVLDTVMKSPEVAALAKKYKSDLMASSGEKRVDVISEVDAKLVSYAIIEMRKQYPEKNDREILALSEAAVGTLDLANLKKRCPYLNLQ